MSDDLLQQILAELQKQSGPALGFGFAPRPRYIYANRQNTDCLWYFWNGGDNVHIPIEYHALTGFITKIEVEEKEFKKKKDLKLNIHVKAERMYIIQSGLETLFSKGVIYALKEVADFSQVLSIAVEPGNTEQVLFGRVYVGDQSIYAPYDDDANIPWQSLVEAIQSRIEGGAPATQSPKPNQAPQVKSQAPAPKPAHESSFPPSELSGQGLLVPNEGGNIVDRLKARIKGMTAKEIEMVSRELADQRQRLGEMAYDLLLKDLKASIQKLNAVDVDRAEVTAKIGTQISLLGWSKAEGSDFIKQHYDGRTTRAELSDQELVHLLRGLEQELANTKEEAF
jgi:hypothetical protein